MALDLDLIRCAVAETVAPNACGRRRRLVRLGVGAQGADSLAALHTRNFM